MNQVTIKLECIEAQIFFTELHAIIHKRKEAIADALAITVDGARDEWDKEVARGQMNLYAFQIKTYEKICSHIKRTLFIHKS